MARAFVVVDIPSRETLIGQLTLREPGCTVDLLGRPDVHAGQHLYQLHYIIRNISPAAKEGLEASMKGVMTHFETISYVEAEQTWTVYGEIPVENIQSPGLRFVAGLFGLAPMPWALFENGVGHARLLPGREDALARIAETLDARLASAGIKTHSRVEKEIWFEQYQDRIAAAGWDA